MSDFGAGLSQNEIYIHLLAILCCIAVIFKAFIPV